MEYITRKLEDKLLRYIDKPEIIAVTGPRQSGKTTLITRVIKKISSRKTTKSISFEDPDTLNLFERDLNSFCRLYTNQVDVLFIDEFQYASNGGKLLKQIYDSSQVKIIITGSSSPNLSVKTLGYLVGRIMTFKLYPFDFEEFISAKSPSLKTFLDDTKKEYKDFPNPDTLNNIPKEIKRKFERLFTEYTIYGGYPRSVLSDTDEERKEVLRGLYSTLIMREIHDYLGLIQEYNFTSLLKYLALKTGNIIEYNELSKTSGYTYPTLKKYLNLLEQTYVYSGVKPFFRNRKKELVKNPKSFFYDTGLRNITINDFRPFDSRPDTGALIENAIFMEAVKSDASPLFWRDKTGNEVDFIFDEQEKRLAIEVKLSKSKCQKSHSSSAFIRKYPEFELLFTYLYDNSESPGIKNSIPAYFWPT